MGKKIYVGNLPFSMNDDSLRQLFTPFGSVESVRIITDRATGRSKGFGFVEMATDAEADSAIKQLDGVQNEGRALKVNEAKPMEERSGGGGGGGYGGGGGGRSGGGGGGGGRGGDRGGRGGGAGGGDDFY